MALAMADTSSKQKMSLVFGPREAPLCLMTLGAVIEKQANDFSERTAVAFPGQQVRMNYRQLKDRSKIVAKSILEAGLQHGDCVGIIAGNCYQYIEVFLGAGRIGCPVVVLNNTYSPQELLNAVSLSRTYPTLAHLRCSNLSCQAAKSF
jgi:acyl-CoA synthetase (AMP-forming)/AMP-acid ligase II